MSIGVLKFLKVLKVSVALVHLGSHSASELIVDAANILQGVCELPDLCFIRGFALNCGLLGHFVLVLQSAHLLSHIPELALCLLAVLLVPIEVLLALFVVVQDDVRLRLQFSCALDSLRGLVQLLLQVCNLLHHVLIFAFQKVVSVLLLVQPLVLEAELAVFPGGHGQLREVGGPLVFLLLREAGVVEVLAVRLLMLDDRGLSVRLGDRVCGLPGGPQRLGADLVVLRLLAERHVSARLLI